MCLLLPYMAWLSAAVLFSGLAANFSYFCLLSEAIYINRKDAKQADKRYLIFTSIAGVPSYMPVDKLGTK